MKKQFVFLTSNRFWALVIGAVSIYVMQKGYIGEAEMQLVATLTGVFVTVRTIDRFGEKPQKVVELTEETT